MNLPKVIPLATQKARLKTEIEQALNRKLPEVPSGADLQYNVEVVRLAIELARLRGTTEPGGYLAEAAKLLTEAGAARAKENDRPEIEVASEVGTLLGELAKCGTVSDKVILRPGKSENREGGPTLGYKIESEDGTFHWTPFRTEKGFRQLLTKHYDNICAKAATEMRPLLCQVNPKIADAENYLRAKGLFIDTETAERLREIKNAHDGTMFLGFWQSRAVSKTVDAVMERAKAGWLDGATLRSIAQTRHEGHVARASKAVGAKKAKVNIGRRSP